MSIFDSNPDLFRAILSMDSYDRGYNAALDLTGTSIGTAQIGVAKGDQEAQSASFFAQSYTWNGEIVVSYRGTDSLSLFGTVPSDVPHWGIAFGNNYRDPQAVLAAQF